jgi:type III secretory pathway component EscV
VALLVALPSFQNPRRGAATADAALAAFVVLVVGLMIVPLPT